SLGVTEFKPGVHREKATEPKPPTLGEKIRTALTGSKSEGTEPATSEKGAATTFGLQLEMNEDGLRLGVDLDVLAESLDSLPKEQRGPMLELALNEELNHLAVVKAAGDDGKGGFDLSRAKKVLSDIWANTSTHQRKTANILYSQKAAGVLDQES